MRVLVACEFSAVVRDAFRALGHDAWSCDLIPCEGDGMWHLQQNCQELLWDQWDLMIAHPPCTSLASSGARWWGTRQQEQIDALSFVSQMLEAPIDRIAVENPIGIISTAIRPPDQIIQPWMFGHGETKATCLWLKNLPLLQPTDIHVGNEARVHRTSPSADRWKIRSRTLPGIARAMAEQWSF